MTRVLLADDHPVVRQGVRALLSAQPDLTVVGETDDGLRVVDLAEELKPDVVLLDVMLPGLTGLEVTRQIKKRVPKVQVCLFSMHANEAYVLEGLRNGALGYVLKSAPADEILRAVREVAAGRRYLAAPFSDRAIEAYAERVHGAVPQDPWDGLSAREREVFQLAAEGLGNTDIGRKLSISPRTVEVHRSSVLRKLGLLSQTDLVRYAVRRGVLEP